MKILITGAAGFLGMHLVKAARDLGDVTAVVRPGAEAPEDCERVDLSNREDVQMLFERSRPDVVLHAAARTPQTSSEDIYRFFGDNVLATVNVYNSAKLTGVRRVVFSSTFSVYGRPQSLPVGEDHPLVPETPYALSKIQGESTARCYALMGLETTVLRYSGIFGPGQRSGAIPAFITRCLQNAPLKLNAGGRPSSDFVSVHDVVQANLLALKYTQASNFEVMNIGSGSELTIGQLAEMTRDLCESASSIEAIDEQSPRDFRFVLNISEARNRLGYAPTPVEAALREFIRQKKES